MLFDYNLHDLVTHFSLKMLLLDISCHRKTIDVEPLNIKALIASLTLCFSCTSSSLGGQKVAMGQKPRFFFLKSSGTLPCCTDLNLVEMKVRTSTRLRIVLVESDLAVPTRRFNFSFRLFFHTDYLAIRKSIGTSFRGDFDHINIVKCIRVMGAYF